jgi:homoserine dehydrogenase
MPEPLRIALAGLGTVGAGVIRLIERNGELVARRAGRPIEIAAVCARDRSKDRGIDLARYPWEDDMTLLAGRSDVDVVVELVGGADGPALALARRTLAAGKGLVTANKAMIAHHGLELAEAAEAASAPLKFEAAVAGGVPVIKGLREGAAANRILRIYGILNGTCNYILSTMERTGRDFADVLREAQELGYAEADPTFDIEGTDAAHKLAILAAIAFGSRIDFGAVEVTGITRIRAADIAQAAALGYVIRLIGLAEHDANRPGGCSSVSSRACSARASAGGVDGPTNAVVAEGNFAGRLLFQGAGAGDGPTASAVVADLIDIARGDRGAPFSVPVAELETLARPTSAAARVAPTCASRSPTGPACWPKSPRRCATRGVDREPDPAGPPRRRRRSAGGDGHARRARKRVARALALLEGVDSLTGPPLVMPLLG